MNIEDLAKQDPHGDQEEDQEDAAVAEEGRGGDPGREEEEGSREEEVKVEVEEEVKPKHTPTFKKLKDHEDAIQALIDKVLFLEEEVERLMEREQENKDVSAQLRKELNSRDNAAIKRQLNRIHAFLFNLGMAPRADDA